MWQPVPHRGADRGFTLIELMVVIAVLAIVMSVAAPGMRSFSAGQQVKAAAHDLTTDLLLARNEALKRGVSVTLSPAAGAAALRDGWQMTSEGQSVAAHGAMGRAVTLTDAPASIVFDANGRVSSPTAAVRITVGSSEIEGALRCVELDLSGRARSNLGACS